MAGVERGGGKGFGAKPHRVANPGAADNIFSPHRISYY